MILSLKKKIALKLMVRKAVTLTEVIVGAVILAAVFAGLLASFVTTRKYINRAHKRLVTVNLARAVLDKLYSEVRQDNWNVSSTPLYAQNTDWHVHQLSELGFTTPLDIDKLKYGGNYEVSQINNRDYRQVRVNITYPSD